MKKIIVLLTSLYFINTHGYDFNTPSVWAVGADKVGVSGSLMIRTSNSLSLADQPFLQGWIGDRKIKKEEFQLNATSFISNGQKINLKEYIEAYKKKRSKNDSRTVIPLERYSFIRLGLNDHNVYIDVKDFDKHLIITSLNEEKVFIEIPTIKFKKLELNFSYNNLFANHSDQKNADEVLIKLPELNKFVNELKVCVKKKDSECLVAKVSLGEGRDKEQGRIRNNFIRKFIFDDPKSYEIYKNTRDRENESDNHIPEGIDKKIDYSKSILWQTLQEALDLDLKTTFINFESSDLDRGIDSVKFFRKMKDEIGGNSNLDLRMTLVKTKAGWLIKELHLTGEDEVL